MAVSPTQKPLLFNAHTSTTQASERLIKVALAVTSAIPLLAIAAIAGVFIIQSWAFFQAVPWQDFLLDTQWAPSFLYNQRYGVWPLVSATVMVSTLAMVVAVPTGLLSAIYLSESAPQKFRSVVRSLIDSLSGVPTIVYGYFALQFLTPQLQKVIPNLAVFNGLGAGVMTGLLITPIIAGLCEDALRNVDEGHRQAAYACGLTRYEMIWQILVPAAFPGIVASFTLAASRALGETMIAAIAAGQNPNLTLNPLVPVETMTGFIVQASLGDVPTNSVEFHTIFAVGMLLFLITLVLNSLGHWLVYRYRRAMAGRVLPIADVGIDEASVSPGITLAGFSQGAFGSALAQRHWMSRLFTAAGLLASLVGPLFLAILAFITLRLGFSELTWQFIAGAPSSDPKSASILAALVGTLWLLGLTILLALPLGLAAAIYLEEYIPPGRVSRFIKVGVANATAVPSILYGLLGVSIFVEKFGGFTGGRSILAAAMMMTLLVLPLLITASRTALQQVPVAFKQGGYAVGMSQWQVVCHIVLPAARPGLLTGVLLTASRIVGETSPLIALGAVGFVTFVPRPTPEGLQSSFTTVTTQIFFWLSNSDPDLQAKAAAAVLLLGGLVLTMNGAALLLRNRLQRQL